MVLCERHCDHTRHIVGGVMQGMRGDFVGGDVVVVGGHTLSEEEGGDKH